MNRSSGVIILTVLQVIAGLLNLFNFVVLAIIGLGGAGIGALVGGEGLGGIVLSIFAIFAIIELIQGICCLILAIGIFYIQSWAWVITLIVHIVALLKEGSKLTLSGGIAVNFLNAGFSIASLYYLTRLEIRQEFKV
ncbi:MAG: hypothetical protein SWY16_17670 [Cyanobacteriota bacterium]|nr:hypothetical protein [Cyanobacteriota bacterium]